MPKIMPVAYFFAQIVEGFLETVVRTDKVKAKEDGGDKKLPWFFKPS